LTVTALVAGVDTAVSVTPSELERDDVLALLMVFATVDAADVDDVVMEASTVMDAALMESVIASVDTLTSVASLLLNASCAVVSKALMVDAMVNATFTTCL